MGHIVLVRRIRTGLHSFLGFCPSRGLPPRRKIQQNYHCLGFHATCGCSRAPICLNSGSTMHSEEDCKTSTRCRSCGGPHRLFSRDCRARLNKFGPVDKKQPEAIRQAEHIFYAQVACAKAVAKRVEGVIVALTKDISMAEGSVCRVLKSEEEA